MKIIKITAQEPAADELKRCTSPILHPRFQPNIRFRFRKLTADDGFLNLPFLKKIAGCGYVVQARANYQQRRYGKVWDMVLSNVKEDFFLQKYSFFKSIVGHWIVFVKIFLLLWSQIFYFYFFWLYSPTP